jgi:tetratricopeptide (TPR) repeat protein
MLPRHWRYLIGLGLFSLWAEPLFASTIPVDRTPLLEARALAGQNKTGEAIRLLKRTLDDSRQRAIWDEALIEKIRLLANSGDSAQAIRVAERAARTVEFRHKENELLWWTIILYAGPEKNLDRAISRAVTLSQKHPADRDDIYIEQAAYALGILNLWNNNRGRARRALEEYLRRYENGRYTEAARKHLQEL